MQVGRGISRSALLGCLAGCLSACLPTGADGPRFEVEAGATTTYRYETADGRVGFAGSVDQIPAGQRETARPMALDGVALNTELGNEIAAHSEARHEELSSSAACEEVRTEAERSAFERLLTRHRPTLGIVVVALMLVFAAPFAMRHLGAPEWARVLAFALPVLGMLAALTFGLVEAQRGLERVRHGAVLCDSEGFRRAPIAERLDRLDRLTEILAAEGAVVVTQ